MSSPVLRPRRTFTPAGVSPALWKFEVLVGAVGAILLGFSLGLLLLGHEEDLGLRFTWILLLFLAIAVSPGVTLRRGSRHGEYRWWEYPAITGIIVGPWYLVPVAAAVAMLLPLIVTAVRRPTERHTIPFSFGTLVSVIFGGALVSSLAPPWTLVAGVVASAIAVELLIYRHSLHAGDTGARDTLTRTVPVRVAISLVSAVVLWSFSQFDVGRYAVLMVPALYFLGRFLVATAINLQQQRAASQTMEEISANLIGLFDEHSVIQAAAIRGVELFGVDEIVIEISNDLHDAFRWTHAATRDSGIRAETIAALTDCDNLPPAERDRIRCISLTARNRVIGQVILRWDKAMPAPSSPRMQFLNTFGHAVAATLLAARTHNEVSRQAAAKAYEAQHDKLTGLGNRAMLFETGPTNIEASVDLGGWCALLLVDLDGFKGINDTLGHAAGDRVLQEVGKRFASVVRKEDLAIRLGGDEFAILATNMANPADADLLAAKLQGALITPVALDGLLLTVEASVGIAIHGKDAHDIQTLYQLADIALYKAKARGRGTAYRYLPSDNGHTTEALALSTELRNAIHRTGELVLHYQPQVSIDTGSMVGMEALVRWNHPHRGLLSPDKFVPLAEQSAFIRAFTLAIVRQALAARAAIRDLVPDATVSVNLAARNLLDQGLPRDIQSALREFGVPAEELVVEVTETSTPADLEDADKVLHALRAMGVQVAFDDFLTGYASLEALRRQTTPLNEIKIERDFVQNMMTRRLDRVAVKAIVDLAHARDCRVVAEGVETEDMLAMLGEMGCDYAQGYLIARPQPLDDLVAWIQQRATADGVAERVSRPAP